MTFSISVMWLHKLKLWKTMPSLERMRSICLRSAGWVLPWLSAFMRISSPSMMMRPSFGCSSRLMQRRKVLFPEPEEPIIDTTSPGCAEMLTPLSTESGPKRL